ncbi:MAG: DNA polymerase I, partial [Anaerolineae bacterium]|nr:DNA polymerase I [Anaerolineae bacterium]
MPKLVLLDGHSLAFRAYHALPPDMATSRGELTNAVYGFTSMLLSIFQEEKPDYIAAAFDVGPSFRNGLAPEYKGTRARMPDELQEQISRIHQVVEAFNIPIYTAEGFEADDVLGTLARQAEEQGVNVVICTGDRDLFQLIDEHIVIRYTPGGPRPKTKTYDLEAIRQRYHLEPRQLIDFRALIGDKSDNIPGIPGIGEKTAARLLQQYGSLEGIYEHLDEISRRRLRESLAKYREQAFFSKQLVTVVTDVPVVLDLDRCRAGDFDRDRVLELFRELEFHSLIRRLPESHYASPTATTAAQLPLFGAMGRDDGHRETGDESQCLVITMAEALHDLVHKLEGASRIAFDVESTSTNAMRAKLVGLAVAWGRGQTAYIPVGHLPEQASPAGQLPWDQVRDALAPIFADDAHRMVAHNANYDITVLRRYGLPVQNIDWDTMIAEWLLNPASHSLGLKSVAFSR